MTKSKINNRTSNRPTEDVGQGRHIVEMEEAGVTEAEEETVEVEAVEEAEVAHETIEDLVSLQVHLTSLR